MPTLTGYTKVISSDFPNGKVNVSTLHREIEKSSIIIAQDHIDVASDECKIWFKDALDTADQMELTRVVAEHQGEDSSGPLTFKVEEESTKTGGNFGIMSVQITAGPSSTATLDVSWPFPISALSMKYLTEVDHKDDTLTMIIAPDTIIGGITADITGTPSNWVAQNYVIGDIVLSSGKAYTCVRNTLANDPPTSGGKTNSLYWRRGYAISVSSTVIANTMLGYYITLDDLTNSNDLGRVIYKTLTKIYTENHPTVAFTAATPTYVRQNIYLMKDLAFGRDWCYEIGDSKIGGSYIPEDIIVRLKYHNNNVIGNNTLYGMLEYLY